jgi:adenine-specific DNA-methyltransferase
MKASKNLDLFEEAIFDLETSSIKYIGSKKKLLNQILGLVSLANATSVLDCFSGSTRVSQALANNGFIVHANDLSEYSRVIGNCFLNGHSVLDKIDKKIQFLNSLTPTFGWYSENYGGDPKKTDGKKPWQLHNTMKLDAIRTELDRISESEIEKCVLLTSLIMAMDEVDNTLGHQAAYLKEWSARSFKEMHMRLPKIRNHGMEYLVTRGDALEAVLHSDADLVYLDPPYGSNNDLMPPSRVRYSAYYHIWTTICFNDSPEIFGVNGRREDSRDEFSSAYEEYKKDEDGRFLSMVAFDHLLTNIKSKHILVSYSSGGRATREQLMDLLCRDRNLVKFLRIDYKENVMSLMTSTAEWVTEKDAKHQEYLILLESK